MANHEFTEYRCSRTMSGSYIYDVVWCGLEMIENKQKQFSVTNYSSSRLLKCYNDQKYEFFVLSMFRKYKYILLTVQSFKSKFVREVRLF